MRTYSFVRHPSPFSAELPWRNKIAVKFPGPPSSFTPLQRFLKWSVSEPKTRTVSPFSKLTVLEWVENRINEGTVDGLRAAIQVDPTNARLAAHFGRALANYALANGTDPDKARRARAEADYQTHRALELAPDNDVSTLRIIWHRSLLDIWQNGADGLPAYLTAQNFVEYSSQTRMLS